MSFPLNERRRFRAAFTLIELLTVIAIIGILAAMIIPTVGKVRESARNSQSVSNLRQLALAAQLFTNDVGYFPGGTTRQWWVDMTAYTEAPRSFGESGGDTLWFAPNLVSLHGTGVHEGNLGSYAMNRWLFTRAGGGAQPYRVRMEQIGNASRKALLMESLIVPPGYFVMQESAHYIYQAYRGLSPLNNRDLNVAFVDGHVQRLRMDDILTGENSNDSSVFWGVMAYE